MKGKDLYGGPPCLPPCTNQFRLAALYVENIIYVCYKTSYLNEEVDCTEPSPYVSVPWVDLQLCTQNTYSNVFEGCVT